MLGIKEFLLRLEEVHDGCSEYLKKTTIQTKVLGGREKEKWQDSCEE